MVNSLSSNVAEVIDRTGWAAGPWDAEPDRVEFTHRGLPCLMVRHPQYGHWCGYAAALPGHPRHGLPFADEAVEVKVHGGLTYAAANWALRHTPKPGEPADVWWFGFGCAHGLDKQPGLDATERALHERTPQLGPYRGFAGEEYRDMAYVRGEVERLAEQIADAAAA